MNTKKLSVVLVVLVGLLIARGYYRSQKNQASQSDYGLKEVDSTAISSLTISNPDGVLEAVKTPSGWRTQEDISLDETKIASLIAAALAPEKSRVVSETDRRHQELEVADASPSARITFSGADNSYEILLGIRSGTSRYTRVKDAPQVYLVEGFPSSADSANIDDWYDAKVVALDASQLKSIKIEGVDTLEVTKKDDGWHVADDEETLSEISIGPLVNEIDSLVATDLFAVSKSSLTSPAVLTITITKQDDSQIILEAYQGDTESYLLTASDREGVFKINQATFDNLQFTDDEIETTASES